MGGDATSERHSGAGRAIAVARLWIGRTLAILAGIALVCTMLFTAADVLLRSFGRPIAGSFEVIGWLSAVAMSLALGYSQAHRGHVAMTLLSERLHGWKAALSDTLNSAIALALFGVAAYYLFRYADALQSSGSLSETLKVVVYPWVFVVAIGFAGLALVLALDLLQGLERLLRRAPRDA